MNMLWHKFTYYVEIVNVSLRQRGGIIKKIWLVIGSGYT